LTETKFISWADEKKSAIDSVGMLLPNIEAKIIAEDGREMGYDDPGELCVRGPSVMKGYLNDECTTNKAFDKDGFLYMGDVAVMNKQGNLDITDRLKELIKYTGFQIAPAELEEIIISRPAVLDAAVLALT
ncbi:13653_t:CDS:2, partial [Acaulospora morrowiae]